ncbi:MAG: nicotinate phosphoribosyltransferase [Actinomycetes bacterium]|jgi:nicotinate phosphoribosyltransferase|nr:nicotinate phosphoribosyltransferase [Actinomycetes bacterium]
MTANSAQNNTLLTDLYQLTMAAGYLASGLDDTQTSFTISFRENPFDGGFAIMCGLADVADYLENWRLSDDDIAYLRTLNAADGTALFPEPALRQLADLRLDCEIAAIPEGTPVFARDPLLRVTGSLVSCQLVETTLLNIINFQTLIATKAARCYLAAQGAPILEFGLRRAQGPDGGLSASRAAYIGGCSATSNVAAGRRYDIPVAGTHAHSWVMAHESEQAAFDAWLRTAPNNTVLTVDTYDTLQGVERAIVAARALRERGGSFAGIRIDSGDLAWLSVRAREMLDAAGFTDAKIIASNDLDEYTIASLIEQGAAIDTWGVGTRLVTADGQPSLGGIYKMTAIRDGNQGEYKPRIKVSEQASKTTTPGLQGLRRYYRDGKPVGDMIYDLQHPPAGGVDVTMVDPADMTRRKSFAADTDSAELLQPFFADGDVVAVPHTPAELRANTLIGLDSLDATHKRLLRPHSYPVGLEQQLYDTHLALIKDIKQL